VLFTRFVVIVSYQAGQTRYRSGEATEQGISSGFVND
jgi:hypothetical protein